MTHFLLQSSPSQPSQILPPFFVTIFLCSLNIQLDDDSSEGTDITIPHPRNTFLPLQGIRIEGKRVSNSVKMEKKDKEMEKRKESQRVLLRSLHFWIPFPCAKCDAENNKTKISARIKWRVVRMKRRVENVS